MIVYVVRHGYDYEDYEDHDVTGIFREKTDATAFIAQNYLSYELCPRYSTSVFDVYEAHVTAVYLEEHEVS